MPDTPPLPSLSLLSLLQSASPEAKEAETLYVTSGMTVTSRLRRDEQGRMKLVCYRFSWISKYSFLFCSLSASLSSEVDS